MFGATPAVGDHGAVFGWLVPSGLAATPTTFGVPRSWPTPLRTPDTILSLASDRAPMLPFRWSVISRVQVPFAWAGVSPPKAENIGLSPGRKPSGSQSPGYGSSFGVGPLPGSSVLIA